MAETFEWIDSEPLASASIAQVHRARLRHQSQREVVIKVQHDGVDALMMHDLETVRLLTHTMAWLEPDMDFRPLLDAWCQEVPKELDFRIEAQNMAEVSANIQSAAAAAGANGGSVGGEADPLRVEACLPRVVPEYTSRRLLVMSYEEGARLTDPDAVAASGVDIAEFIRSVARAYARQMFIDGIYNADPHPGNFLVSTQPSTKHMPILLDFGLCTRLTPALRGALAKLVVGVSSLLPSNGPAENAAAKDMLMTAFAEMGWPIAEQGGAAEPMLIELAVFLFRQTETLEEVKMGRDASERTRLEEMAQTTEEEAAAAAAAALADSKKLLLSPIKALPGELIFFQRVLQLLRGLAVEYSVKLNFVEVWDPFARQALGLPLQPGPPTGQAGGAVGGSADPDGEEQAVAGTSWLMGFDDDGDLYYKHIVTKEVVWDQPAEVAAAERRATAAAGGGA